MLIAGWCLLRAGYCILLCIVFIDQWLLSGVGDEGVCGLMVVV